MHLSGSLVVCLRDDCAHLFITPILLSHVIPYYDIFVLTEHEAKDLGSSLSAIETTLTLTPAEKLSMIQKQHTAEKTSNDILSSKQFR